MRYRGRRVFGVLFNFNYSMKSTAETGRYGEQVATNYLRQRGFLICDINWRQGRYEIDIVAQKGGITHFVEVKTRRAGSILSPEQTLNKSKLKAMHTAASIYLNQRRVVGEIEFDLLAVDIFPDDTCDVRFVPNVVEYGW